MRSTRLLLLAFALGGCVTVRFTPLAPYSRPPRAVGTVAFLGASLPTRPSQTVGTLRVRSSIGYDAAVQQLMQTAANYGCDAVTGVNTGVVGASRRDDITANCVLWTEAAPAAPQPAVPFRSDY